ncbi:MAG: hypothetical protein H7Y00_08500 [Fimbriimonadaceae bacterium]|nr:hypothetical protein [Chitinophagales bacterium]
MKQFAGAFIGLLISFSAYTQIEVDFIQSVGAGYYTSFLTQVPTLHYQPRVNFFEISDKAAISFDLRLAGGYFEEPQDIASDAYVVIEIPILINFNYGCGATRVADEHIGYYGGLGWGNEIAYGEYYSTGPMFNAGFRFDIDEKSPIDINVGLMLDVTRNYNNVFSAGISYMFGMLK